MYHGLVLQEATVRCVLVTESAAGAPANADALPTFRVYGPTGFLVAGTCALLDSGAVTGASNASPITVTAAGHGLTSGAVVQVAGVLGNTAANGVWVVTVVDGNTFQLNGSSGNGAYTSGGTWDLAGAYVATVPCLGADGFAAGENYEVVVNYQVSAAARAQVESFTVV